jgi:4-hydroxy-L-threonine phosphate dehydrogenase PdxA
MPEFTFTGHTEYLAERTGTRRVVMMLAGGGLRVALVTTHLPLREVPAAVTDVALQRRCASCIARWGASTASPDRASWLPGSIRMLAKAATWAAKRST